MKVTDMAIDSPAQSKADTPVSMIASWLFPSVKDILFLTLFFSPLLAENTSLLGDSDTGWHIRNGEQILRTWTLPRSDYFSYTAYGKEWFAWEWLADVVMGGAHHLAGLNGVVFVGQLLFALTFTLLFSWTLRKGSNLFVSIVCCGLATLASSLHWLARPHLFTMLILLVWYILVERLQTEGPGRWTWSFPIIILVWTNLHGGFVVGLVLLLIYALGNWLTGLFSQDGQAKHADYDRARLFARTALICGLASLINPYGPKLYRHIFHSYVTSGFLVDIVTEFLSPNFHMPPVRFFELLLLGTIFVFGASRKRLTFIEIGLLVFWTHLALFSARHIPLYTLVVTPILCRHLSMYVDGLTLGVPSWVSKSAVAVTRYSSHFLNFEAQFRRHLFPVILVAIVGAICLNQGRLFGQKVLDADFPKKNFPVDAARFIEGRGLKGNAYTMDQWGGYLVYRLFPNYKTFLDGRSDMYGEELIKEYLKLLNAEYQWKQLVDKYNIEWILLPVQNPLASVLKESSRWKVIYDDQVSIIFVKSDRAQ